MIFRDVEAICRRVIAPYAETLAEIPRNAWQRFLLDSERLAYSQKTVRANVVWGLMIDEADRLLLPMPGVQPIDVYNFRSYLLAVDGDDVLVRFKKLDEDGLSRNFQTYRAQRYNGQLPIREISPAAIRLDVGYQLNELETTITNVIATHRNGDRPVFSIDLDQTPAVIALPVQWSFDDEAAAVEAQVEIVGEENVIPITRTRDA